MHVGFDRLYSSFMLNTSIVDLLSNNLKLYRRRKSLTQSELAQKCSVSLYTIRGIEQKRIWPNSATLEAIANALDIEPRDLFFSEHERNTIKLVRTELELLQKNILKLYEDFEIRFS